MTDVHCITKGRTFHLQKKKVHNKSSDLSSDHPVAPAPRGCESPRKMRFPRGTVRERDAPRRLPRFQNSKGRLATLHFGRTRLDGKYAGSKARSRTRKISLCLTERTRRQPRGTLEASCCWLYGRLRHCHT